MSARRDDSGTDDARVVFGDLGIKLVVVGSRVPLILWNSATER